MAQNTTTLVASRNRQLYRAVLKHARAEQDVPECESVYHHLVSANRFGGRAVTERDVCSVCYRPAKSLVIRQSNLGWSKTRLEKPMDARLDVLESAVGVAVVAWH